MSQNVDFARRWLPGNPANDAGFVTPGCVHKNGRLTNGSPGSGDVGSGLNSCLIREYYGPLRFKGFF
jgi:hypothetical protein